MEFPLIKLAKKLKVSRTKALRIVHLKSFPLIKLAKKLKVPGSLASWLRSEKFPLIKLAKKLKVAVVTKLLPLLMQSFH